MMRSLCLCMSMALLASFCLTGCSSTGRGLSVFTPYRGANQVEELKAPPADDPRYTQAPSYPQPLLKPVAKLKDEENGTGLRRAPAGQGSMVSPLTGAPGGF